MLVFLPSLSINFSALMIIDRSLRTRLRTFSSLDDFFSKDENDDVDFSRYPVNATDLLCRLIRAGSSVKAGAMKLEADSFILMFSGLTKRSETVHSPPPVPSTIGKSSRYKSHFPRGLSLPTWCGQSMSTSTKGALHGPSLLICLTGFNVTKHSAVRFLSKTYLESMNDR